MTSSINPPSARRFTELLDDMKDIRATVVGDVMLDRYLIGDVERISPEAPVPVLAVTEERATPGGAANVAANLAALGAEVLLIGAVGDDEAAAVLGDALSGFGVSVLGLATIPGRPTTTKTRILARGQQVVRIDREVDNPMAGRHRDAIVEAALAAVADSDVLLLGDYDKGVLDPALIATLIRAAGEADIPVVADPKRRHFFDYTGATVLKPNRRELGGAFHAQIGGNDAELQQARSRLGVDHLLLTLGAEGMALVSEGKPITRTPSITREVYDVSGAGDTVAAWVAAALAAEANIEEAAWLANVAAGVEVGKQGTATVTGPEVIDAWRDFTNG